LWFIGGSFTDASVLSYLVEFILLDVTLLVLKTAEISSTVAKTNTFRVELLSLDVCFNIHKFILVDVDPGYLFALSYK